MPDERLPTADYLVFFPLAGSPIFGKKVWRLVPTVYSQLRLVVFTLLLCKFWVCLFWVRHDWICLLMTLADLVIHAFVNLATAEICATMSTVRLPSIVVYSLRL